MSTDQRFIMLPEDAIHLPGASLSLLCVLLVMRREAGDPAEISLTINDLAARYGRNREHVRRVLREMIAEYPGVTKVNPTSSTLVVRFHFDAPPVPALRGGVW